MSELGEQPHAPDHFTWPIEGKAGTPLLTHYIRSHVSIGEVDDPELHDKILPQIATVGQRAFPHWGEAGTRRFLGWLNGTNTISYTTTPEGQVAGFSVFTVSELEMYDKIPSVMYTAYAGVDPDFEGQGIYEKSLLPIVEVEKPDVVAGCTGNPAIYVANRHVASQKGYDFYPTGESVPEDILELGRNTLASCVSENAANKLSPNLIKNNKGITARGKNPFPYFDQYLKLEPTQQVLYLLIKQRPTDFLIF